MPVSRNFSQVAQAVGSLTNNLTLSVPGVNVSRVLVDGVLQVRLSYPEFKANVGGQCRTYAAGTVTLNTEDVPQPTTFYVYIPATTAEITVSTTNPESALGRNNFAWAYLARLISIGGAAFVYFVRRMYTPITNLLGEFGDYASDIPYTWVSGFAPSIDGYGQVSLEAGEYRRMKFASSLAAEPNADILLEDEATLVTSLEQIDTYSDDTPITPGSWHKVLLLLVCSGAADERLLAVRQGRPPGGEYITAEEARVDAARVAAAVAPSTYYAPTLPLAYVWLAVGDASVVETQDLRLPGLGGGGGGGAGGGVFDHSLALNLSADTHLHYLNRNGARAMQADLDLAGYDLRNAGNVAYGSIFVSGATAEQQMAANVPAKLVLYTHNGPALNATPDAANDEITVTAAGIYRVTGTFSFSCSSPNIDARFFAAVDGVATVIGVQTRTSSTFTFGAAFDGLLALNAGAVVSVLATTTANPRLTLRESQLTVERVG
jgi:hypothetical protein